MLMHWQDDFPVCIPSKQEVLHPRVEIQLLFLMVLQGKILFVGWPDQMTILRFLRLRGQSPVTLIDGVQRDIFTIDPENIESVSVLKDGFSTIMLGMRGSRGAILVTTKKPIAGTPHVSFTAEAGIQTPLGFPESLPAYQYAYLYNEALYNANQRPTYEFEDFDAYRNQTDPYGHPDVDWFNTILKGRSLMSNYNLNLSGGGSTARYSVGLSYLNQEGLFRDNNPNYNTNAQIQRYTINTNIDVDVTKSFIFPVATICVEFRMEISPAAARYSIIRFVHYTKQCLPCF